MNDAWPELDWPSWRETAQHLHLMTQVVGKVRLAHSPWLNHGWQVALYPTARGLGTGPIPAPGVTIQIDFDLIGDMLSLASDCGETRTLALRTGTMAGFHGAIMEALAELGVPTRINVTPNELPGAYPFTEDFAERPYDGDAVRRFHRALLSVSRVFARYRTGFLGKSSPVHFFWGSFDLAETRFSGRAAPRHPGGFPGLPDAVTCEAYSHEEASAGFWPGSDAYPKPAFYAYSYPAPEGYGAARVSPEAAAFSVEMGEWLLDYDAVRTAADPDAALLAFLQSTYDAAADLGGWDRAALECPIGHPRVPRVV